MRIDHLHAMPLAMIPKAAPGRAVGKADALSLLKAVEVPRRPVSSLEPIIGGPRYRQLVGAADQVRQLLAGRTIWNVNSTATGGGVAEMLQALVGYVKDLDIPIGWLVIGGDAEFFAITKRLHNQIHGSLAAGPLGTAEAGHYTQMLAANAVELLGRIRPGDLVLLHDPQTAGLAAPLLRAGAQVVWRCHIGVGWENDATRAGWNFLRPHLTSAQAYVFSRRDYVPSWLPDEKVSIIPPSIDPFSPKNQLLDAATVRAILAKLGVLDGAPPQVPARFIRRDGDMDTVTRPAVITGEGRPGPDDPVVIQVSRWDRLKDMAGVMRGFAAHVAPSGGGYLMLAGPSVAGVADDPEGAAVYGECLLQWHDLPAIARARVLLVTLPLDDIDENAAMVNALQRHATVITQKSLAEGFGLTVSEGMWKARPIIGSAVGGIIDQITKDTGILLPDPADLKAFGQAIRLLLGDQAEATRMGLAAQAHVREHYLGDIHLMRYARLLGTLISERLAPRSSPGGSDTKRRLQPLGDGVPSMSLMVRSKSSTTPLTRCSTCGGVICGKTPWSFIPLAKSRWITWSCRSRAIRSRSSKTARRSASLRCSANSSAIPACAANVVTSSTAAGGSGIDPGWRPTVSTPRTLPGPPSGNTTAGPRSMCSRAACATRSSWRKSSTVTGWPVARTCPGVGDRIVSRAW
jgi:trehalose synthase